MNWEERDVDDCGSYAGAWALAIRGIQTSNGTKKYPVYLCIKNLRGVFRTSKLAANVVTNTSIRHKKANRKNYLRFFDNLSGRLLLRGDETVAGVNRSRSASRDLFSK